MAVTPSMTTLLSRLGLACAAHRKCRASLARGNALFLHAIWWKELGTDFRRAVLGLRCAGWRGAVVQGDGWDTIQPSPSRHAMRDRRAKTQKTTWQRHRKVCPPEEGDAL